MLQTPANQAPLSQSSTSIERETFRWLFIAEFNDDTVVEQTQEDICHSRDDGTGSAFTDVIARENDLTGFMLRSTSNDDYAFVDLVNGSFLINDVPFIAHDQNFDPTKSKLKLVYFRENMVEIVQSKDSSRPERHYVNRYFMGWEAKDKNGKNVKAIIAVG